MFLVLNLKAGISLNGFFEPPSLFNFFGLNDEYMGLIYEQFFFLKMHGGWSFIEAYNLPIKLRNWFVRRLKQHFEDEKKAHDKMMKKR